MERNDLPRVLIVDDKEEELSGLKIELESAHKAIVDVRWPDDVETADLIGADLVLVDYDLERWVTQDAVSIISKQPPDGLALATLFRRYLGVGEEGAPTAVAIITGKVKRMSAPFPPENRAHLLAKMNNLEWVFLKQDKQLAGKVTSLASTVRSLPADWGAGFGAIVKIAGLLGLDQGDPRLKRYCEIIEACHPPAYELPRWTHGLAVVRWLTQRILPYPCFLWDAHHLAARLRVDYASFDQGIGRSKALSKALDKYRYKGVLAEFDGPRWWRTAVELFLWELTNGEAQVADRVREAISGLAGFKLKPSAVESPIVCIDANYHLMDEYYDIGDAVRIQPDDWPPYADQAWMPIEVAVGDPALRALVVQEDQWRLDADE